MMTTDPSPAKLLKVRSSDDSTWEYAGSPQNPFGLRTPGGTWEMFGNGNGTPLRLRMPDNTWQIVTRTGIGQPKNRNLMQYAPIRDLYPTYGMPAVHGWNTQRTDFTWANGNAGAYYDSNYNRAVGAGNGARSYSFTGDSNSGVSQERNVTLMYGWYVIPIGILKQDALNYMSSPYVQNVYPKPYLFEMGVDFILNGYSVIVGREPFYPGYTDPYYFIGLTDGTGHILYQGHTEETEGPYHWESPYEHIYPGTNLVYDFPSVPVVRNKPLIKESGVEVWQGPLNALGTARYWDQYRQPVTITHKLDLGTEGGIQYHFYTSDPAAPLPLHDLNLPRTYDNSFQVQIVPWFNFAYGDY